MPYAMLRYPRLALCILVLVAAAPLALLGTLEVDNAPETYLPEQADAVQFERVLRQRFPEEEVLIALFEGKQLFEPDFLRALEETAQALEGHSLVERALTVTTTESIRTTPEGFAVEPLVDGTAPDARSPDEWRTRATEDRNAAGLLVSEDGAAHALIVRPRDLRGSIDRLAVERLTREAITTGGLETALTALAGPIALDVAQLRAMVRDNVVFIPGVLLLGLTLLWLLFHRWLVLVAAVATTAAGAHTALAVVTLLGQPYNLIATITAPLLAAIAMAALMHLFNGMHQATRAGRSGLARMEYVLGAVHRPILFTALTTAAGLASLALSPIQPIATLGISAAVGVLMIYFVVTWLLPPIVLRWDRGAWGTERGQLRHLDRITRPLTRCALRYPLAVVIGTILILAMGLPQLRHITVETDLYRFFDQGHALTQATERVEDTLGGVMPLEVVFDAAPGTDFQEPDHLRVVQRFQSWLAAQPEVDYTFSLVDVVEDMHQAFHEGDPDHRRLPDNRQIIAQYLLIYDGRDLYDIVDRDFERARLVTNLNIHGAREVAALTQRMRDEVGGQEAEGIQWTTAGTGRLFADQVQLLTEGQVRSLVAVSILIFAFMWLIWRSLPTAALCMIPNAAPILCIFIAMGAFGIWLDTGTAMIASVAVGIAVDDTIHLFHAYRRRRARGAGTVFALARAIKGTGRAVCATTLVLCLQFLLLTTSDFQPTQAFGLLTAGALAAALLFDLLLLPAILSLCRGQAGPVGGK